MSLRDEVQTALAKAHDASPYGRRLSAGDPPVLPNMATETLAQALQHLLFVTQVLEDTVVRLAEAVEARS